MENIKFSDLELWKHLKAVEEGFGEATPIQAEAIPVVKEVPEQQNRRYSCHLNGGRNDPVTQEVPCPAQPVNELAIGKEQIYKEVIQEKFIAIYGGESYEK
jgi:hypothetical protein